MKISTCLVTSLLAAAACDGKTGNIALDVVVSPNDDPFASASQVRFTVGTSVTTVPVTTGGHFSYSLSRSPISTATMITIEALSTTGQTVGFGETPALTLPAEDQSPIAVWVGRPGKVQVADTALPSPRAEMTSFSLGTGGIIYAGGRDKNGTPLSDALTYSLTTQTVFAIASLNTARAGAVAGPVGGQLEGVVFGGSTNTGFGSAATPVATSEEFNLIGGDAGLWTPITGDAVAQSSYGSLAILPAGDLVVAGGFDANKNLVATAQTVAPSASPTVHSLTPMIAPRQGHAMVGVTFADGPGALVFGGLPDGSTAPIAERYFNGGFSAITLPNIDNRRNATATLTPSGDVLILGGRSATGVEATGFVVALGNPITTTALTMPLTTGRENHTTTVVGPEIIVCGGDDANGVVVANCDVLDSKTYMYLRTEPLTVGRRGHTADLLVTNIVVIAGGITQDGTPTDKVEIYTPSM